MLWLLLGCPKPAPISAPAPASEPSALLVLVVVDQLPVRLLETPKARFESGFATLTGPGAAVRTARYAHAITYTCPGHATISTGAAPAVTGIVSNDWYLPGEPEGTEVYCGDAANLRVGTLADRVREAGGQVAAVSLKDRGATMMSGTAPHLLSHYDRSTGDFTGALAGRVDVAGWMREWTPLFPDDYLAWVGPDDGPFEGDPGLGTTFPHPAPTARTFLYTPFSGSALVDAALLAADDLKLGQDGPADLLTVSFSQTDYIGHSYTAESWEAMDAMLRLDRDLGRLIDGLSAKIPTGRLTVLLTSDHGAFRAYRVSRIGETAVEDAANAALRAAGFEGEVHFESPGLWLPPAVRSDPEARRKAALAVADAVRAIPGIGGAFAWRDAPLDGPHAEAVRLSLDEERSGDVYVLRGPDALYDYPGSAGKGTSHGTPFAEDTDVPFLAWGAGVTWGAGEVIDVRRVAPTAARILGVPAPEAATMDALR